MKIKKEKKMEMYICNIKEPDYHCKYICFHGRIHEKEKERDANCTKFELCKIVNKRVKCRKLFKKELKLLDGGV